MILYNKPNITPTIFDILLKYIYTGELDLKEYQDEDILELLVASDELLLEELFDHVQDYLIKNRTTWIQKKNFDLVLNTAFKLMNCRKLQDFCLKFICIDPQPFITSESFLSLDKDILYNLFEREDLQIDEIVLWECLIKWGIKQTPGNINSDIVKWNNKNYEALKKTLGKFIPLIRFVEISPSQYYDKVRPYKAIIPNHIFKEVEEFHFKGTLQKAIILPPRVGKIKFESTIIKKKLVSIIINWINKRDAKAIPDKNDLSYNFNLIYQGSKDEINNQSFINNCNMKEPILVLIKCKNSRKIFGGYTPAGFYRISKKRFNRNENNQIISSSDSFIFSFENNNDTRNMRLSHVKSHIYNIYNNNYGDFGFNFGERSLYMQDNNLYVNYDFRYGRKIKFVNTYIIEEIEAFKVVENRIDNYDMTKEMFYGIQN
ncbi:unnamed protein product [Rhizophagus irregularis]|nr:unnamed protein product [Rhizophagus irregularis]